MPKETKEYAKDNYTLNLPEYNNQAYQLRKAIFFEEFDDLLEDISNGRLPYAVMIAQVMA